ncbi:prepilin-type N-terminal cleavage/methylation domain-containing protein [Alkalihalobacillus sp. FSL W8-0930]
MRALLKKHLKNQKGLTLIELLAVVVILGIISAIAIPSIGGIIANTQKDAHIANAEQMVNAVKTAKATQVGDGSTYTLDQLVKEGLIEDPVMPGNKNKIYDKNLSKVTFTGSEYNVVLREVNGNKDILRKDLKDLRGENRRDGVNLP